MSTFCFHCGEEIIAGQSSEGLEHGEAHNTCIEQAEGAT